MNHNPIQPDLNQNPNPLPMPPVPVLVAKKKFPLWAKIVIPVAAVVATAMVAVFIVLLPILKNGDSDTNAFLNDLENNNLSAAWDTFSPELQQTQSKDDFVTGVATLKLSTNCAAKWDSTSIGTHTSTGTTKSISGTLNCPGAAYSSYNISFTWVQQGGVYKLWEYSIRP